MIIFKDLKTLQGGSMLRRGAADTCFRRSACLIILLLVFCCAAVFSEEDVFFDYMFPPGEEFTYRLTADGTALCWGDEHEGRPQYSRATIHYKSSFPQSPKKRADERSWAVGRFSLIVKSGSPNEP